MTRLPITRANINGKRRFVCYQFDLIEYLAVSDVNCRFEIIETLKQLIKEGKLRDNIDWTYHTKRQDIALTLSSTQILLAIYATQIPKEQPQRANHQKNAEIVWHVINKITDFLQGIKA